MSDAIKYGNRLIMMSHGQIIVDVSGENKTKLTIETLLELFNEKSHQDVLSDCPIEEYNDMWTKKMSNGDWINFLVRKFDVSRTIAKEMLHSMMEWKKTDRFNKQFCGSKDNVCQIKT